MPVIEDRTEGIEQTSGYKRTKPVTGRGFYNRFKGKQNQPTLKEIQEGVKLVAFLHQPGLENNTEGSNNPAGRANRDADPIRHQIQHKRRVGSCDQKKNAGVVNILERLFGSDVRYSVI